MKKSIDPKGSDIRLCRKQFGSLRVDFLWESAQDSGKPIFDL